MDSRDNLFPAEWILAIEITLVSTSCSPATPITFYSQMFAISAFSTQVFLLQISKGI